jgi:hypothetical protein
MVGNVRLQGVSDTPFAPGTEAWLSVRPEAIRVADAHGDEADPPDRNVLNATISELVYAGSSVRLHATIPGGQRLMAHVQAGSSLQPGAEVRLTWPIEGGRCVR